jgi:hypothetical protein
MAGYPVHRRASASTAMLMACNVNTSTRSPARPGVVGDGFVNMSPLAPIFAPGSRPWLTERNRVDSHGVALLRRRFPSILAGDAQVVRDVALTAQPGCR